MGVISGQLVSSGGGDPASDYISWWKFDGNPDDSSANGNDFSQTGALTYVNDRFANSNKALYSGTTTELAEITDNTILTNLSPSSISLSLWIKIGDLTGTKEILFYRGGISNTGFQIFQSGSTIYFYSQSSNVSTTLSQDTWYHVVFTHSDTTGVTQVFVDTAQVGTDMTTGTMTYTDSIDLGHFNRGFLSVCSFDDFRVYDRVLTPTEITGLYNYNPN